MINIKLHTLLWNTLTLDVIIRCRVMSIVMYMTGKAMVAENNTEQYCMIWFDLTRPNIITHLIRIPKCKAQIINSDPL
jgi:hypothetical protein